MNVVVLSGRLARDPELRMVGEKGTPIAFFTLAVARDNGTDEADFVSCKVVGQRAEWFAENVKKGRELEIRGRIQTWLEGEGENLKDRYIVSVEWFKAKRKPRSAEAGDADGAEGSESADVAEEQQDAAE